MSILSSLSLFHPTFSVNMLNSYLENQEYLPNIQKTKRISEKSWDHILNESFLSINNEILANLCICSSGICQ